MCYSHGYWLEYASLPALHLNSLGARVNAHRYVFAYMSVEAGASWAHDSRLVYSLRARPIGAGSAVVIGSVLDD